MLYIYDKFKGYNFYLVKMALFLLTIERIHSNFWNNGVKLTHKNFKGFLWTKNYNMH